uniref:Uncharacterized protein n=1 Tax=Ditylenchus dipsaci TaxID=166011 RepID=A0A915EDX6_9BILA
MASIRNICSKNKVLYESDGEFRNWTNLVAAIAFVPVKEVSEVFEILRERTGAQSFSDYFEDVYVGRIEKGTERKKPRYAMEKWSVHQLVRENEPRTNNAVMDEHIFADQRVSSYWSGGNTLRRNNAHLQLSERLRKIVQKKKIEAEQLAVKRPKSVIIQSDCQVITEIRTGRMLIFEPFDQDIQDELCINL